MIKGNDEQQLRSVHEAIVNASTSTIGETISRDVDDDLLKGSLEAAYYIGRVSTMSTIMEKASALAEEFAKPGESEPVWGAGYVEAGNNLIQAMIKDVEEIKSNLKEKGSLGEIGAIISFDDLPRPR